jgi:hypothetical protein
MRRFNNAEVTLPLPDRRVLGLCLAWPFVIMRVLWKQGKGPDLCGVERESRRTREEVLTSQVVELKSHLAVVCQQLVT